MFWGFGRCRDDRKNNQKRVDADVEAAVELAPDSGCCGPMRGVHAGRDMGRGRHAGRRVMERRVEFRGDDGVYVSPTPITSGTDVTVKYDGLLSRSGADAVYLHIGFGPADGWTNVRDVPMTKTVDDMWTAIIPVGLEESSRLNFCFRDSANNWDNNNGMNWSYEIHNGENV